MDKAELKKLIDVAAGREKADVVIKNAKVVNVFSLRAVSPSWVNSLQVSEITRA